MNGIRLCTWKWRNWERSKSFICDGARRTLIVARGIIKCRTTFANANQFQLHSIDRERYAAPAKLTWISANRCSSRSSSSSFISLSSNFHTLLHTSHDSASTLSTFCFFDALPPGMLRVNGIPLEMNLLLNSLWCNESSLLLLSFDWFRLLVMLFDLIANKKERHREGEH